MLNRKCRVDNTREKNMRGEFKTAVDRCLTAEDIVVVDTLNYIKGRRVGCFYLDVKSLLEVCAMSSIVLRALWRRQAVW